jgi:hypothetical protein
MLAHCAHVVKIPTRFSINVGMAGAIVMYDRLISLERFAARPVGEGQVAGAPAPHAFGAPVLRRRSRGKGGEG